MSNQTMTNEYYPIHIDREEADSLCIQEGWYIGSGDSLTVNPNTGNPFGSEKEVIDHLESAELSASN